MLQTVLFICMGYLSGSVLYALIFARIFKKGDILEQSDLKTNDIGIFKMIDVFKGHKGFGCVKLKNNYRSEFCELADKMI